MALFIMKNFFLRPAVAKVSETDAGKKALEHYDRISRRLSLITPQPSEASLKSSCEATHESSAENGNAEHPSSADLEMPDDAGFHDEPAEGDVEVDAVATEGTDQPVGPTPNRPTDIDVHYRNQAVAIRYI
eukprot:TRINITY_DN12698_c0_g1_i2.p1 TRINITY_DN12698_c0_g1~~TRINITY_DN12698_c0_g1_i2.p1  ORF type:complete len:151 (-),score=17.70 TRINITY_DN12698_c0_g1_i2:197-589(-)